MRKYTNIILNVIKLKAKIHLQILRLRFFFRSLRPILNQPVSYYVVLQNSVSTSGEIKLYMNGLDT